MDPFEREFSFRRKTNVQAIVAFLLGVAAAYFIQISVGFGGGGLFTTLVVVAVGGLWYHIRRVI